MLTICCTKKLLDELKLKPCDMTEGKPFFSWYANLLTLHRRKAVLLLNERSRYPILIYGLKAPNFKQLDKLILDALKTVFLAEGISPEIVEKYMAESSQIAFTKTSDRSIVAAMNQVAQMLSYYDANEFDLENPVQTDTSLLLGDSITRINADCKKPNQVLIDAMAQFTQGKSVEIAKPVVSVPAYQFLITLNLESHEVWRRVIVPADITFRKLHFVIQDAFGWLSYHMYEFAILKEDKPVAQIVCDEESMEYVDCPASMDNKTKLTKYLPEHKQIGYVYDMGDDWMHYIELEKAIEDYDKNYPICVEGKGDCPPEDVGGEGGYEDFLEAIRDSRNPEHENMLEWGAEQEYRKFDIKDVSKRLKKSLGRRR
jgi:hypothetical protein